MENCKPESEGKTCACPYCGWSVMRNETALCEPCGKTFVNCKKCGNMISDDLTICPHCKEKIE